jgi:hypothetical protein
LEDLSNGTVTRTSASTYTGSPSTYTSAYACADTSAYARANASTYAGTNVATHAAPYVATDSTTDIATYSPTGTYSPTDIATYLTTGAGTSCCHQGNPCCSIAGTRNRRCLSQCVYATSQMKICVSLQDYASLMVSVPLGFALAIQKRLHSHSHWRITSHEA